MLSVHNDSGCHWPIRGGHRTHRSVTPSRGLDQAVLGTAGPAPSVPRVAGHPPYSADNILTLMGELGATAARRRPTATTPPEAHRHDNNRPHAHPAGCLRRQRNPGSIPTGADQRFQRLDGTDNGSSGTSPVGAPTGVPSLAVRPMSSRLPTPSFSCLSCARTLDDACAESPANSTDPGSLHGHGREPVAHALEHAIAWFAATGRTARVARFPQLRRTGWLRPRRERRVGRRACGRQSTAVRTRRAPSAAPPSWSRTGSISMSGWPRFSWIVQTISCERRA